MNEIQQKTARAIVNVFETGRVRGDYSAITVMKGDSGHLSYGCSQAALGSGTLFELLNNYCQQPNAQFAVRLRPYLPRFQQRDVTLDNDAQVRQLLKDAGAQDPVMRATQDQFFNRRYLAPACTAAESLGISDPLSQTVIFDSRVQGGWDKLSARMGAPVAAKTREWVQKYVDLRSAWLKSQAPPLPSTAYRMNTFNSLIALAKWNLELPLVAHGVTISQEALAGDTVDPGAAPRDLRLTTPYLRGTDVRAVQQALLTRNLPATVDGIYGPFTAQLVSQWQKDQSVEEDGVGPKTRLSLGL